MLPTTSAISPSTSTSETPVLATHCHVGWFSHNLDIDCSSTRYRCAHIARVLQESGVCCHFFTSERTLNASMAELDAVILAQRIDTGVIPVVAQAHTRGKAVFLDLSEDLLHPRHPGSAVHNMVLAGIAPFLDGIICADATLAERMADYTRNSGRPELPIHVIPDIAETDALFSDTAHFWADATGQAQKYHALAHATQAEPKIGASVLWFGNGDEACDKDDIMGLLAFMPELRMIHSQQLPLELIIVSNHAALHAAAIKPFGLPTRSLPWSLNTVYAQLRQADLALLTVGNDGLRTSGLRQRILQALAMGVPVVTTPSATLAEFIDCIVANSAANGCMHYLGPERDANVAKALAAAQKVLPRYSPEKPGQIWLGLLTRRIQAKQTIPAPPAAGKLLLVIETGDEFPRDEDFSTLLAYCKRNRIVVDVIANSAAFKAQARLLKICAKYRTVPSMIETGADATRQRLHGVWRVVAEKSANRPVSKQFIKWAKQAGISYQSMAQLLQQIAQSTLVVAPPAVTLSPPAPVPGPYPERGNPNGPLDWSFIAHEQARNWILAAICREIGSRQPDPWQLDYGPQQLPLARNYFFSHHTLYLRYFLAEPVRVRDCSLVLYTHPRNETAAEIAVQRDAFNQARKVIFMCQAHHALWLARGLLPERCCVVLGGADPALFPGHTRGSGVVGLSSAFYERKNPDRLLQLIECLPHRQFCLIGRNWNQYALFESMKAAPNFTYLTLPYEQYPAHYQKFDVFLSLSTMEGGPIPLLETMMCNAVPVASRTGFAPDLIQDGANGFLFDTDAPSETIAARIEAAFLLQGDIRASVLDYSWDNFSRNIIALGNGCDT